MWYDFTHWDIGTAGAGTLVTMNHVLRDTIYMSTIIKANTVSRTAGESKFR